MGKLPKGARDKVSGLAQLDAAEKRIETIRKGLCDDCREKLFGIDTENKPKEEKQDSFAEKCKVDGCDYTALGRSEAIAKNNLRLHGRTHEVKE